MKKETGVSFVIYGPEGCGKFSLSQKVAAFLRAERIVTEWDGKTELPPRSLALTQLPPPYAADVVAIPFEALSVEALAAAGSADVPVMACSVIDYTGDDYPRVGCFIGVDVTENGYTASMFRPNGGLLEVYGARTPADLAEIVQEWCGGRAPGSRYQSDEIGYAGDSDVFPPAQLKDAVSARLRGTTSVCRPGRERMGVFFNTAGGVVRLELPLEDALRLSEGVSTALYHAVRELRQPMSQSPMSSGSPS